MCDISVGVLDFDDTSGSLVDENIAFIIIFAYCQNLNHGYHYIA